MKWVHGNLSEAGGKNDKQGRKIQSNICRAGLKSEKWLEEPRAKVRCEGPGQWELFAFSLLFMWIGELLKCRILTGLCHHHHRLGKQGDSGPYISFLRLSQTFWCIFSNQQHQFLYCRMETLVFLSLITLLPRFYLFRAQGLWDKDLFLLHTATGSLRVACLSNSGLSSATVITFSWNHCVLRSYKPICLQRNLQISALFSVHP